MSYRVDGSHREGDRFVGYHKESDLPIKRGDTVTIPKGTTIRSTHPRHKIKVAGRNYKIKVFDVLCGQTETVDGKEHHVRNPSVEWHGEGGYWCWVDINDVPEAQPQCPEGGKHEFTPDEEYDGGQTINCAKCGALPKETS